jgi:transcriptional regulator GlxA family with amidase domain
VASAKAFAQAHLTEVLKTRDIAKRAHVGEAHFCRSFKAATGMTFSEYVARARVEQAEQLLANTLLRVTDVAFATGFQSIPHFNHTFKRHNGTSPTRFRRTLAG